MCVEITDSIAYRNGSTRFELCHIEVVQKKPFSTKFTYIPFCCKNLRILEKILSELVKYVLAIV